MDVEKLLRFAVQQGASDLHLQAGAAPMLRIGGEPRFVEGAALTGSETAQAIAALAPRGWRPTSTPLRCKALISLT